MNSTLAQKSVVITRALRQADELNAALRERGAIPLCYPCIAIIPPPDPTELHQSVCDLVAGAFDWVVFTSSNSVRVIADALTTHALSRPMTIKIAAVGDATARAVREYFGIPANLIPAEHNAVHIANELSAVLSRGACVLLPQSEIAAPAFHERLTAIGVAVTAFTAYRTVIGSGGDDVPALLRAGCVHAITFTSPSTVENFIHRLHTEGGQLIDLNNVCLACIGHTTARAVQYLGLPNPVIASMPTIAALIAELEQYFAVERI